MDFIQNVIEYYDELYPVTQTQRQFYGTLTQRYAMPAKILRVGCGTGVLEHSLAKDGHDVTGIDSSRDILQSATLRKRSQLMSMRFLQMAPYEMRQFLGKGFYNIISVLYDRIIFIHEPVLLRQFFADCRALLTPGGSLVVQMTNFGTSGGCPLIQLPVRQSIRVRLFTEIHTQEDGAQYLYQNIETGNGRMLPVLEDRNVCTPSPDDLLSLARQTGFAHAELFSDYARTPFDPSTPEFVAVFS